MQSVHGQRQALEGWQGIKLKLLIGMEGTGNTHQHRLLAQEVTAAARHGRCKQ